MICCYYCIEQKIIQRKNWINEIKKILSIKLINNEKNLIDIILNYVGDDKYEKKYNKIYFFVCNDCLNFKTK